MSSDIMKQTSLMMTLLLQLADQHLAYCSWYNWVAAAAAIALADAWSNTSSALHRCGNCTVLYSLSSRQLGGFDCIHCALLPVWTAEGQTHSCSPTLHMVAHDEFLQGMKQHSSSNGQPMCL
jgi:hypothetical protein